jgi:hypothetical protein
MSNVTPRYTFVAALALAVTLVGAEAAAQTGPDAASTGSSAAASAEADHQKGGQNPYLRSDIIMWSTVGLGVLHHTDHVLRANHSGFPFEPQVNEFTYSLGIYPLLLGGYFLDAGPNYWILTESLAFVGLGLAHTLIEPPSDQHGPWAHGTNLLGAHSHATGRGAQVVSALLSVGVGAHLVSSIVDGVNCGFTWTRRESCSTETEKSTPRVSVTPRGEGMELSVGFAW